MPLTLQPPVSGPENPTERFIYYGFVDDRYPGETDGRLLHRYVGRSDAYRVIFAFVGECDRGTSLLALIEDNAGALQLLDLYHVENRDAIAANITWERLLESDVGEYYVCQYCDRDSSAGMQLSNVASSYEGDDWEDDCDDDDYYDVDVDEAEDNYDGDTPNAYSSRYNGGSDTNTKKVRWDSD